MAVAALRCCVSFLLVIQILYTPVHLRLVPHSDDAELGQAAALAADPGIAAADDHDGHGRHERHSASQHQFKGVSSQRAPVAEMALVTLVEWVAAEEGGSAAPRFEFAGLSPPEFLCSWQFFLRAALPVRAPSLLS